jgi:DMSO/TMAO reductase YedYZ heme-binding membrane subunit
VPDAVRIERIKLFAGMLDRAGTVCFAVGVVTPISAFIIGMPQMPTVDARLAASLAVWTAVFVVLHGAAHYVLEGLRDDRI